jgi:TetR/AcrR family transcriptional regulator
MARPRKQQPTDSPKQRIVKAAAEIFAAHGYAGARVDEIADRAAVNKAMVYYHVGDKDELYATVISEIADRALADMRASISAAGSAEDKLRAVVGVMARTATDNPHMPSIILREVAGGGATIPEFALRKIAEVFGTVGQVLQEGAAAGRFREVDPVITHMMIGGSVFLLVAGAPLRQRIRALKGAKLKGGRESTPEALADQLFEMMLNGLERQQGERP